MSGIYGKLSSPLVLTGDTFIEMLENLEEYFATIFMDKDARALYNEKFIFFNMDRFHLGNGNRLKYPERFLHICSIEDKHNYTIFPCNNDKTYSLCKTYCNLTNSHTEFKKINRTECLYRMTRIHWIPEIINLANTKDEGITVWTKPTTDRHKNKIYKHFIRYESGIVDYVIILKEDRKRGYTQKYNFISAYPVFTKRNKEQFKEDYVRYAKETIEVAN